jgi:hypothetical protein
MRTLAIVGTIALALTATGCTTTVAGTPSAPSDSSVRTTAVVPAGLDTGDFPTHLFAVKQGDLDSAWVAEGNRMGDYIVAPTTVDSRLTIGGAGLLGFPVLRGPQLSERVPDITAAIFTANNMKVGDTATRGDSLSNPIRALRIGLYRFDGADTAATVVAQIKSGTARQPQVNISSVPGVTATAFKPGTVDTYVAAGPIVLNISGTAPSTAAAAALVTEAYGQQIPKLKQFNPTAESSILSAPIDRDNMLARTLPSTSTDPNIVLTIGVLSQQGLELRIADTSQMSIYRDAGVDLVATNDDVVYRTKNAEAAVSLQNQFKHSKSRVLTPAAGVPQLPSVTCMQDSTADVAFRFRCSVTSGRYVAEVTGPDLKTAQQKAAAQWVILANNP